MLRNGNMADGDSAALQLAGRLHDLGAPLVSLRCGAEGAFVSQRDGGAWHVPTVPCINVVDVTGDLHFISV